MPLANKNNQISWKLVGKELKQVREDLIKRSIKSYGMPRKEAEEAADIWINAVNETARESGEDV